MSGIETIKINEVEYVRKDSIKQAQEYDAEIKIVVLDRGFVYIGLASVEGDFVKIQNAHNLRVWGTTKGLGELVKGPTSKTQIDHVGNVSAPLRALISIIDVEQGKWSKL